MSEPPHKKSRFFKAGKVLGGLLKRSKSKKEQNNLHVSQDDNESAEDVSDGPGALGICDSVHFSAAPPRVSALPTRPERNSSKQDKGKQRAADTVEDTDEEEPEHSLSAAKSLRTARFKINLEDDDDEDDLEDEDEDDALARHRRSLAPPRDLGAATEDTLTTPKRRAPRPVSQAAEALGQLNVRDTRRQGVYGAESLLPDVKQPTSRVAVEHDEASAEKGQEGLADEPPRRVLHPGSIMPYTTFKILPRLINPVPGSIVKAEPQAGPSISRIQEVFDDPDEVQPSASRHAPNTPLRPKSGYKLSAGQPPPSSRPQPPPLFDPANPTERQPFLPRPRHQLVDADRDAAGKRLPVRPLRPIINLPNRGVTNLPLHATKTPSRRVYINDEVPEDAYMSPNRKFRLENPQFYQSLPSRKRKRGLPTLPPPAYIYTHTGDPDFNVFRGILLYPELCMALAAQLPVNDLISLYAISRDFHTILDARFTTVILSPSLRKAPESSRIFAFRSYKHLCRIDPAARIPHPDPEKAKHGSARCIPSFRWLKMVLHREKVVHELMTLFAEEGVPLPPRCSLAIKKMWFLMDIPDNPRRIGYIHCKNLVSDVDLYFAMCFFVKLDMRLIDPVASEKRDQMRKMLLSQETFTTILKYLKGDIWRTDFEILKEYIKWKFPAHPGDIPDNPQVKSMFGVPREQWGTLRLEYRGRVTAQQAKRTLGFLLRPEQCVMREAVRRGLRFHRHFLRCLLYGYVRPDTLENYEPRKFTRRIPEWADEEYDVDDVVGGVNALSVEEGGDDVLDLGPVREVSKYTIVKEETTKQETSMRAQEEAFLDRCMDWWRTEVEITEADRME